MQQILKREPWTAHIFKREQKLGTDQGHPIIFEPYHVWITSLYRNFGGWYRTEESITSGVNAMRLVFESLV